MIYWTLVPPLSLYFFLSIVDHIGFHGHVEDFLTAFCALVAVTASIHKLRLHCSDERAHTHTNTRKT